MMKTTNKKNHVKTKMSSMLVTFLLAAVMILSVGCGKSFDASGYVKSFMDLMTKGEVEDYMKFTGETKEEALEEYNAMTDAIMESIGGAGASEEVQQRFVDVYKEILAKSKYTVGEAEETENDGYKVDISIEPITGLYDGLAEEIQTKAADYAAEMAGKGETLDQSAITDWVFNTMIDMMEERMDSLGYGEAQTITVELEKDGDKYKIKDEEEIGSQIGMTLIDISPLQQ